MDRLIIVYEQVTEEEFDKLFLKITALQLVLKEYPIYAKLGISVREFHRQIHIGQGDGAIFIGYKHNSSKTNRHYKMKIEFNPAKFDDDLYRIFKVIHKVLPNHKRVVTGLDIAFDIESDKAKIIPVSVTGRSQDKRKGTIYYGEKSNNGYLKIYDKKKELKEKQKIEIEAEHLTRIEYSWRYGDGLTINELRHVPFRIDELYKFSVLDLTGCVGVIKACVLAVSSGDMEIKELSRTYAVKTKRALEEMAQLALDSSLKDSWSIILDSIKKYTTTT